MGFYPGYETRMDKLEIRTINVLVVPTGYWMHISLRKAFRNSIKKRQK